MVDADAQAPGLARYPRGVRGPRGAGRDARRAYVRIRERFLAAIADVIEALCEKHGLTLLVPPLEARRLEPSRGLAEGALAQAGARSPVHIEVVPSIPRESGHAAKLKLVVSEGSGSPAGA